jgi:branched-chain amino acid transport system substrate-binding protein
MSERVIRRRLPCIVLQFVGLIATVLAAGANAESLQPIKIGEINSYSAMPEFTQPYRNGWQLAVDEINAAGGINGRTLKVISRDDGGDQKEAIRQVHALIAKDKVDVLAGTYLSNIGLAVSSIAARHKLVFVAAVPLSDALTWDKGNRYTFRLRPSTYMQAAMLVDEAAKLPAKRWAILAPNYEYGQSAVASFKLLLKARRPDVEFVTEQWPPLGKLNPSTVVSALAQARPDAIFNATFGADLEKFVSEGVKQGLFANTVVVSMLAGEQENLALLKGQASKRWIVTGYPWAQINTPEYSKFAGDYYKKYNTHPRLGSLVGYTTIMAIAQGVKKAGSADSEKLIAAMRGLNLATPLGPVTFRAIDQQSTLGAYVGTLEQKDGKNFMAEWRYADGKDYLPHDDYVRAHRPAAAMK